MRKQISNGPSMTKGDAGPKPTPGSAERPTVPAGREIERRLGAKDKPRFGMAEIGRKTK